jgi:hypothetical protein
VLSRDRSTLKLNPVKAETRDKRKVTAKTKLTIFDNCPLLLSIEIAPKAIHTTQTPEKKAFIVLSSPQG